MARNLAQYTVPGHYSPPSGPINYEVNIRDMAVINSPDNLISDDPFADILYPLNTWGPDGGFDKNVNVGGLANTVSNQGPYTITNADMVEQSLPTEINNLRQNVYAPQNGIQLYSVSSQLFNGNPNAVTTFQPYYDPWSFTPSTYTPYQILTQDNPTGDNGSLSSDSFIAQLGARTLKRELEERNARNLIRNTVGRINLMNAIGDPLQAVQLLQGKRPLIERDWTITRPGNIVLRTADFLLRLQGAYYPGSEIPGDYFTPVAQNQSDYNQTAEAYNYGKPTQGFLGRLFGTNKPPMTGSILFLNNTGGGQKSQLFYNLNFNKYTPDYEKKGLGGVFESIGDLFRRSSRESTKSAYYIGDSSIDPSRIDSPAGDIPINAFGQQVESPVYGPDKQAKLFESVDGTDLKFKIGLAGQSYTDDGQVNGGLVWSSPKYNNAGYRATIGGGQGTLDPQFGPLVSGGIEDRLTSGFDFKDGSILDNTQRLIDSTPEGAKRLSHVGNAINQLSKVFNDGYKEITKGSKVVSYVDVSGAEIGKEYCRVFTKDTPYLTFDDLQKTDGNIRKFNYSVLDNTYNLNIAPMKAVDKFISSTNIKDGKVTKYMFSIENLAWRTSNRPGVQYDDLPECEKGPNGGRIMWFPPYNLSFSETVQPQFDSNTFLGRPEPIYTYKSTSRTGQLSWTIIVDHPSILNLIVAQELKGKTKDVINGLVDSFFAGCKKYDIYELAKKYSSLSASDLASIQTAVLNSASNPDDVKTVGTEVKQETPDVKSNTQNYAADLKQKYEGLGYYFDYQKPRGGRNFDKLYEDYVSTSTINEFKLSTLDPEQQTAIENTFQSVVVYNFQENENFLNLVLETFEKNKTSDGLDTLASIEVTFGTSEPTGREVNEPDLTRRRIDSIVDYFKTWNKSKLRKYINDNKFRIIDGGEKENSVQPKTQGTAFSFSDCAGLPTDTNYEKRYSPRAIGCRRAVIRNINVTIPPPTSVEQTNGGQKNGNTSNLPTQTGSLEKFKDGISKKLLRSLLSECSYFEMIQQNNPMFYDSMKEKIKYFTPAFHSMTPEGLNSRLTFLQQCTRPGDTIPVIDKDNKPKYDNAVNTAFGAPPVLVLRIGDFYNTKIIPTNLGIQYEPLLFDLNPEGIGVQPMLAKVSLSFNFVGGSGLKDPIDKLQNALSFNFYANTEMYDERADETEIKQEFQAEDIIAPPVPVVENQPLTNDGGETIGVIQEKVELASGATGTTTFQRAMDEFIDSSQGYFNTWMSKMEQITKDYNYYLYSIFTQDRNYKEGVTNEFGNQTNVSIFGKQKNLEKQINNLVKECIDDIERVDSRNQYGNDYIRYLYEKNLENGAIRRVKRNMKKALENAKDEIITNLNSVINEMATIQLNMVKNMRKIDIVCTNTDGYVKTDQSVEIYNLTPTTEVDYQGYSDTQQELQEDYRNASESINQFYTKAKDYGLIDKQVDINNLEFSPSIFNYPDEKTRKAECRFFTLMSKIILDDNSRQKFVSEIVTNDIKDKRVDGYLLSEYTQFYFDNQKNDYYKQEYDLEQKIVGVFKTDVYNPNYEKWQPFDKPKGKIRKFEFSGQVDGTQTQIDYFKDLYKDGNSNTNKRTFNGKNKFN